jgi:hypothetical protein
MLLFLLPQVSSDGMQIVVKPLRILLTHPAYFFDYCI